jgi:transcription initiation factor IIE alpha subunit
LGFAPPFWSVFDLHGRPQWKDCRSLEASSHLAPVATTLRKSIRVCYATRRGQVIVMSSPLLAVEALISTVARAFYNDTVVVMLEGLLQEKYIIEEELGPRLKLTAKEVRKITTQLESEMMIKVENVSIDDSKSFLRCFYIDFQQFVDAVRYRIHLMQKAIVSEEKTELKDVFFQCPTCKSRYSSLEAQRLLSRDFKFVCLACIPENLHASAVMSEDRFKLREMDNTNKLSGLQLLERKLEEQMNRSKLHEGIFDLLHQLRDVPLGQNLPSQNMERGIRSSLITDDRVADEIRENFESATGEFGTSLIKKKTQDAKVSSLIDRKGAEDRTEFKINIQSEAEDRDGQKLGGEAFYDTASFVGAAGGGKPGATQQQLDASLPHFLRQSRVVGAEDMLRGVKSLQEGGDSEPAAKRPRVEEAEAPAADAGAKDDGAGKADDDEDDDVAWEDADDDDDGNS